MGQEEMDWEEDVDQEIQDIPNAHFDVLDSSLPRFGGPSGSDSEATPGGSEQYMAQQAASALLSSGAPSIFNPGEKPLQKPKWHFGIRSRSPPMEVMLEIYKTLGALGMEWRRKDGIALPEIGLPPPGDYPEEVDAAIEQWTAEHGGVAPQFGKRAPPKKEQSAQEKAAQGLYHVETRAQYGDVVVSDLDVCLADPRYGWTCNYTGSMPPITLLISAISDTIASRRARN
jgi:carbon catabolite-derepressing protein kinase